MMSRYKLNALLGVTLAVLWSGPVAASAATMTGEPRAMVTAGKMAESAIPSTENIAQMKETASALKKDKGKRGLKKDKAKKWIKKINEQTGNLKNYCKAAAARISASFARYARRDGSFDNRTITRQDLAEEADARSISLPIMANAAVEVEEENPSWRDERVLNWVIDQNSRHYWNAFYGHPANVILEHPAAANQLFDNERAITQDDIERYIRGPSQPGCDGEKSELKKRSEKRGDKLKKKIKRFEQILRKDKPKKTQEGQAE